MKRQTGFTLIELMVVIVMLGVLAATALGFMAKYRQRTIGSEAKVMMKQIIEGEIMYFLGHETFFPNPPGIIEIFHSGTPRLNGSDDPAIIQATLDAINVAIPVDHLLDFNITTTPVDCTVSITSAGGFNLFPGARGFSQAVDNTGKIWPPIPIP